MSTPKLPPTLRLGSVHLTVTDLDRSVGFYQDAIGLRLRRRGDGVGVMGAGTEDLVVLVENPAARPPGRHAGLYHFALLHPSRQELARAAQRLLHVGARISGASDHGISEAIYLPDPDGNGIELAADRPRDRWGDLRDPAASAPEPLDMAGLLGLVAGEAARPEADPRLTVGHVHLHVGDVERGLAFYRDVVGFEPMTLFPSAAFVSAGGYHHHLAFNTWRGEGVPPAPAEAVGLRRWTVLLEAELQVAAVRERLAAADIAYEEEDGELLVHDPWNIPLLLSAEPVSEGGRATPP